MNQNEAEALINHAVDTLVARDAALLEFDVTERALTHQLGRYMADFVTDPLAVDCEYNRHGIDPKRLHLPPRNALDREIRAVTVFPDIIVHERGTDARNLLVVEVKKPGEGLAYDALKLRAFREELGYLHAAHLTLGYDDAGVLIREVQWDLG